MGLPSRMKVRHGQKKWILRRALRGIVPDAILDGPKRGFSVPVDYWMRGPLATYLQSVLLDPSTLGCGLFDRGALEIEIGNHAAKRSNNGLLLYKLLNLALWHRLYISEWHPERRSGAWDRMSSRRIATLRGGHGDIAGAVGEAK
jgi:asparagine synthase (glutamine-hydrolysing)